MKHKTIGKMYSRLYSICNTSMLYSYKCRRFKTMPLLQFKLYLWSSCTCKQ